MSPLPILPGVPGHLLLVKPSSLGDILHTFPLVTALKATRPDLSIDWIANGEYCALVSRHPAVRNVWEFPRKEFGHRGFLPKFQSLAKNLRGVTYDVVLDAQGLLRSALLSRLALFGQTGGMVAGFANGREGAPWFYNVRVPVPESRARPVHAVDRNMLFLPALGIDICDPLPPTRLSYGAREEQVIDGVLHSLGITGGRPFSVIHPGARRESKKWPPAYFAELVQALFKTPAMPPPVLLGDRSERDLLFEIERRSGRSVPILSGEIPLDLIPLFLGRASFFVGNDSGPLHMAALAGIPTLSFFGSSDPGRTGPAGNPRRNLVLREPLPCSPCGDFKQSCAHMTCQVSLTPELAMETLATLLRGGPS